MRVMLLDGLAFGRFSQIHLQGPNAGPQLVNGRHILVPVAELDRVLGVVPEARE